jgi:DNA-binding XRE family transcriptional regulator
LDVTLVVPFMDTRSTKVETLMKVDGGLVKRLREEKSWSQEHLATVAGTSHRTIQRVESDGTASLETRMALASALAVSPADLGPKPTRAPLPLGARIGFACGVAGAAAGMAFGWIGTVESGATGQDAGAAYGTMATLTGITCAVIGVVANRLWRRG